MKKNQGLLVAAYGVQVVFVLQDPEAHNLEYFALHFLHILPPSPVQVNSKDFHGFI